jgi:hypothetical protein
LRLGKNYCSLKKLFKNLLLIEHKRNNKIKYLIFPPRGSSELIHNQGSKKSFSIAGALDVGGDLICISVQ